MNINKHVIEFFRAGFKHARCCSPLWFYRFTCCPLSSSPPCYRKSDYRISNRFMCRILFGVKGISSSDFQVAGCPAQRDLNSVEPVCSVSFSCSFIVVSVLFHIGVISPVCFFSLSILSRVKPSPAVARSSTKWPLSFPTPPTSITVARFPPIYTCVLDSPRPAFTASVVNVSFGRRLVCLSAMVSECFSHVPMNVCSGFFVEKSISLLSLSLSCFRRR